MRILVTGATGFVGGLLTRRLLDDGYVRCLVRDPGSEPARGAEASHAGDLTRPPVLDGVRAAYFLVHMIGGDDDYPAIERAAAGASVALPARPGSSGLSTSAVSATSASSISQLGTTPRSRFATRAPR